MRQFWFFPAPQYQPRRAALASSRCATSYRSAFSLIELLIVIAMMGILAAVALPSLSSGTYEELESTAQIVASDLAYGRSLAVANNSRYRYSFDVSLNRYILKHSGTNPVLNALPPAPSRAPSDPPDQQITDLGKLPRLSNQ